MSLTKKLANLIAPEDKPRQCTRDAKCHRCIDHEGECRGLQYALRTNLETAARDFANGVREWWRQP